MADASAKLYSPALLALATELANHPIDDAAPLQGRAKSRTCGSEVALSADVGFSSLGLLVSACAVGQASAAIFASSALGLDREGIEARLDQLERWLAGEAGQPDIARIEMIEPARGFAGRHAAILLPWRAALDALSTGESSR